MFGFDNATLIPPAPAFTSEFNSNPPAFVPPLELAPAISVISPPVVASLTKDCTGALTMTAPAPLAPVVPPLECGESASSQIAAPFVVSGELISMCRPACSTTRSPPV